MAVLFMKRVAIVPLFDLYNYGNRLQNYALTLTLDRIGCRSCNIIKENKSVFIKYNIKQLLNPVLKVKDRDHNRNNLFWAFQKNIKTICFNDMNNAEFDYFVCGSDQIWHPRWSNSFLFLEFAPESKRIAFSASFGVSLLPEEVKAEYKKRLSEMKAISVREETGASIVKELTGKNVPVLIDPTLMLDKDDWRKVSKKPRFYRKSNLNYKRFGI